MDEIIQNRLPLNLFIQIENKALQDLLAISKASVKTVKEETNQPAEEHEQSPQAAFNE